MTLKEIQQRNYAATVRRGLITEETTVNHFYSKMKEECDEWYDEAFWEFKKGNEALEIADIIITCLNTAKHRGIDIQKALEDKTIINENRCS